MRPGYLIFSVLILVSCHYKNVPRQPNTMKDDNNVTIVGIAQHGKAGAIVLTADKEVYYMDGLDTWSKDVFGKEIKVTGVLKVEKSKEADLINEKGEWSAGIHGSVKKIISPVWEIVK